jgi:hypothetical protein
MFTFCFLTFTFSEKLENDREKVETVKVSLSLVKVPPH